MKTVLWATPHFGPKCGFLQQIEKKSPAAIYLLLRKSRLFLMNNKPCIVIQSPLHSMQSPLYSYAKPFVQRAELIV